MSPTWEKREKYGSVPFFRDPAVMSWASLVSTGKPTGVARFRDGFSRDPECAQVGIPWIPRLAWIPWIPCFASQVYMDGEELRTRCTRDHTMWLRLSGLVEPTQRTWHAGVTFKLAPWNRNSHETALFQGAIPENSVPGGELESNSFLPGGEPRSFGISRQVLAKAARKSA